ncbi:MAG: selenium cofactor biosynthesis protein YqeC [Lachnospiraceae bacterium]
MKIIYGEFPFLNEKGHVISFVGAGGKTTLMYTLAEMFSQNGANVIVTTTTHIARPKREVWAKDLEQVQNLWERGMYAVVGNECDNEKVEGVSEDELNACIEMADIVLTEADGAKRMPCKVPAANEPVIPDACDIVIGVMGMDALGKKIEEVCFRQEETIQLLGAVQTDRLDVSMMAKILSSDKGTRKNVGKREYYVVLNKCESEERIRAGECICELLKKQGIDKCILMSLL